MVIDSTKGMTKFVFVGGKIGQQVNNSAQREARELGCCLMLIVNIWLVFVIIGPSRAYSLLAALSGPVQNYIH